MLYIITTYTSDMTLSLLLHLCLALRNFGSCGTITSHYVVIPGPQTFIDTLVLYGPCRFSLLFSTVLLTAEI